MLNNMKRVPVALMWMIILTMIFFFVDYTWIFSTMGRAAFCTVCLVGGLILTGANADIRFWEYEEPR